MSEKNDGGQAFPRAASGEGGRSYSGTINVQGMTLRDWYAGKFAAAWVTAMAIRFEKEGWSDESAACEANKLGLHQADAMLKEREK